MKDVRTIKRVLKKLSALRATLSNAEREVLDSMIINKKPVTADEVGGHALTEAQVEHAQDAQTEVKADALTEAQVEHAQDAQTEVKADALTEAQVEHAQDAQTEVKADALTEAQVEHAQDAQTEVAADALTEAQVEQPATGYTVWFNSKNDAYELG